MKNLSSLSDEEMVQLYVKGNDKAFDEIVRRYESKVFTYIKRSVPDQEEAEDIYQEVFMKVVVLLRNGKYTDQGKFGLWLMRVAHNLTIDRFRRQPSEFTNSLDDEDNNIMYKADFAINENREQELVDAQLLKDVKQLITLLPENQQEIIALRYIEELSFKEIAVKTNSSINTALSRMRYALINLRKMAFEYGISVA